MIPGLSVIVLGAMLASPARLGPKVFVSAYAAVVAIAFFLVGRLNLRAARTLQRKIDALTEIERAS
jgi:hypothetical protein